MAILKIKKSLFSDVKKYYINNIEVLQDEFEDFKSGSYCELLEENQIIRMYKVK